MHLGDIQSLTLQELRNHWTQIWGITPHARIGRTMLEKSLMLKHHQINPDIETRLQKLVKEYKRNPKCFDARSNILKTGTQLTRIYSGKKHSAIVCENGFEYDGIMYNSLSKIANHITGSKWNGYVFFGLKQ